MFGIDLSLELINKVIIAAGVVLFALKHAGCARPPPGGDVIDFDRADMALQ